MGKEFVSCPRACEPVLRPTQTSFQWVTGGLFPGIKRPAREAGYSLSFGVEFKLEWSYTCGGTTLFCFYTKAEVASKTVLLFLYFFIIIIIITNLLQLGFHPVAVVL
jgi:hypothetical protein